MSYNEAKTEPQREMKDIRKKYDDQIKDLKEQIKNKSNEIQVSTRIIFQRMSILISFKQNYMPSKQNIIIRNEI